MGKVDEDANMAQLRYSGTLWVVKGSTRYMAWSNDSLTGLATSSRGLEC